MRSLIGRMPSSSEARAPVMSHRMARRILFRDFRWDNRSVDLSMLCAGLCQNRHNPRLFFRDMRTGYISTRHPVENCVNPAVGDAQRLRDFRREGGTGAPARVDSRAQEAGAARPGRERRSAKPLRNLAIETTTPRRLCPGVVR